MKNRTLLVLAASRYQIPIINQAKNMGFRVVTTDNVPENPGHRLADCSYGADTTDCEAVLEIAIKEKVDGVLAACTDVAVPTAAYVAEKLNLPGVSFRSSQICFDKLLFRKFLTDLGLPSPAAYPFNTSSIPQNNIFDSLWIMKPDRSSGSKGVFIVRNYDEFLSRKEECLSFSPSGTGILERYIEGLQGTCDGIIRGGRVIWHMITDRQTAPFPYAATYGHKVPSSLPEDKCLGIISMIETICSHLGILNSIFDCDFVLTDEHIFILEISPRLGGNSIADLIRHAAGFDITGYAISLACGIPAPNVTLPDHIRHSALVLLGVMNEGHLDYNAGEIYTLRQEPWLLKLEIDEPQGRIVKPFINGRFRVGEALVCGNSRAGLDRHILEMEKRLNLRAL